VLMVLMHLILNDMVKVRGGLVAELALCLIDTDERIASLAKLFFTEYAKKGSAPVYNALPDIVSTLSSDVSLASDGFREILGFLITFIQKDKQTETIVDKLCSRFDASDSPRHHRELAFCLSAVSHNDKSVRKLIDNYKAYGNKLGDEQVHASFVALVAKARKAVGAKADFKAALDELESILQGSQEMGQDGEPTDGARVESGVAPIPAAKKGAKPAARKAKGKATSKKKPWEEEDEADAEADDEVADEENAAGANVQARKAEKPPASKAAAAPKASRARRTKA